MQKITARKYQPFQYEMEPEQSDRIVKEIVSGLERLAAENGFKWKTQTERYPGEDQRIFFAQVNITNHKNLIAQTNVDYRRCSANPISHKDRAYVEAKAWCFDNFDPEFGSKVEELFKRFDSGWFWKYF